jgi:carboxypeptidase family protein/TonB-dependent receptor-like protein
MKQVLRTAAMLLLAAIVATPVLAQSLTGSITGSIKDEQGAVLPGVTVTLTGKQGSKTEVTDSNGVYRFPALEVGAYQLSADLSGFSKATRADIAISPGRELAIDLTLKVSGVAENVTVVGESPVVDVKSSATETTISQSLLFSAPITRTAINVINYAPGVNSSSAYGGGAGSGNALLIDGVDTRDPSGGTAWTFYNYNVVEEYQFQGLGAPAEYGGFTGAVVNTITKSGGNRFSGLFDFFGSNKSLGSNNVPKSVAAQNPTLADPAITKKYADITTQFGGPIKQNKLFFFASAQRFLLSVDPTGGVTERHEVSPRLNFKLTWQPNPSNNFTGHIQYDAYNIIGRAGVSALIANDDLTNQEDAPEYVWMTQYRHLFNSNTFSEVKYTGWWGFYDLNPKKTVSAHFDETGLVHGSQGWFYYADRTRDQVNGSITHYADKFGRHELKFGAEFERSTTRDRYGYNNGFTFYDYGGAPYYAYSYGYDLSGTNLRQSVFAQDAWHATNRLTFNVGVRGDMYQGKGKSAGKVYDSSNWAPRLGVALDVAGDNRTVVKGSYGWYYEGSQTQLFTRALPGLQDYVTYAVNPNGTVGEEIDRTLLSIPYKMANDIKHPRVDETTIGFERALMGDMRLSLTGVWRDNKNFVNSVNPSARWQPVTTTTDTGQTITLYRWVNRATTSSDYIIRNVEGFQYLDPNGSVIGTIDPFRKYRAFMAVLNKRYTNRWQAQISYVFAKATGNVDNSGAAQVSSRQFESPNLALVNSEGEASFTPKHEFKLLGSYQIPVIEASVNAFFRSTSGLPYSRIQQFPTSIVGAGSSTSYRRIPIDPRGTYHLPTLTQLDLRIEKNFTAPGSNRVGIYVDIENVANRGGITNVVTRPTSATLADGSTFPLPFGTPGGLQNPRQVRIGARWSF